MAEVQLIPVAEGASSAVGRVNVFIHGYRSMVSAADVEAARQRVRRAGVAGDSYLLSWMSGRWSDSATVAGLRAAFKATRFRYALSPWSLLVDAGVIGVHEAAQFKLMERRAESVGRSLPTLVTEVARGRPINLIGHSLGARVVHHTLAHASEADLTLDDAVLMAGAADLMANDWPECVARLRGHLYNAYSGRDRILRMTPDLRRRVGGGPMSPIVIDGEDKVVNHHCPGVGHVHHWTRLAELLPVVWPHCNAAPETR